jgi:hypothetical protein
MDFVPNENDVRFGKFLEGIKQEILPGKTAWLGVEGLERDPITCEISQFG